MILTEINARQKECRIVPIRMIGPIIPAANEIPLQQKSLPVPMCVATDCMMWRWSGSGTKGYCGLAGKPEEP